jgi:hypothetical protein
MSLLLRAGTVVVAAAALLPAPAFAGGTGTETVTVQANQPGAPIAAGAVGVNTPIWNGGLLDRPTPGLIRRAGVSTLEFNGGGVSDLYHWRDGSLSRDPDAANHTYDYFSLKPAFTFDQFEHTAAAVGAGTLVHVNYGTGTAQEAAGWVRYANVQQRYHVRDWAIGEEVWGNGGIDGINFEPDGHADKSPQAYANAVVAYARAMKAVDPTIRVGVEVTGFEGYQPFADWDAAVLAIAAPVVDFVDFHVYPYGGSDTSDAALLKLPRLLPTEVDALRQLVDAHAGGHHVDLVAGETNSTAFQTPQQTSMFNALYLADNNLTLLENGVRGVAWWALYNGGTASAGDLGLLSSGGCADDGTDCQPPVDTPFPAYYGMRLFGTVARPGGRPVPVATGDPLVVGHAVREADGTVAVLLGNEDPAASRQVRVRVAGYHAGTVLSYRNGDTDIHSGRTHGDTWTLPAYSLTVLLFRR